MAARNVETVVLAGGLPGVKLVSSTGATCEVYKHGAHVASWKTGQGDDIIFLSSEVRGSHGTGCENVFARTWLVATVCLRSPVGGSSRTEGVGDGSRFDASASASAAAFAARRRCVDTAAGFSHAAVVLIFRSFGSDIIPIRQKGAYNCLRFPKK